MYRKVGEVLVKNKMGQIIGVYSLSNETPLTSGTRLDFLQSDTEMDSGRYSDWKFIYKPVGKGDAAPATTNDNQKGTDSGFESKSFDSGDN